MNTVFPSAQAQRLEDKLKALDAITDVLSLGNRQLLLLDPETGRQMHSAVAVGDIDTAANISVFTPASAPRFRPVSTATTAT